MKLTKSGKYWLATGALMFIVLAIGVYFTNAQSQPRNGEEKVYFLIAGPILIAALGVVAGFRAYYKNARDTVIDVTPRATELQTAIAQHAYDHAALVLDIVVPPVILQNLENTGIVAVPWDLFVGPKQRGDAVRVHSIEHGQATGYARIDQIDGVNLQVKLTRLSPREFKNFQSRR